MSNLKKVLFIFSFLCLVVSLQAQISIGPKVGINLATVGGSDVPDEVKSLLGFQFGAVAEIGVSEMFAIQPEILYLQKGVKVETEFLGQTLSSKAYLNYLEIPILAKIMFGEGSGPKFFGTVGPSFGFGLNGKVKITGEEDMDIDFDDENITKLDISLAVGAGAKFAAGSGNFFVDARYLLGLNTTDDQGDESTDVKNRGIGISAGFLFPIGGN